MSSLVQEENAEFADLDCLFEKISDGKEVKGPQVRFYFKKQQ